MAEFLSGHDEKQSLVQDKINKKEFLICIDSDGSAMDTMEPKHRLCFAPLFAKEFGFDENFDEVVDYWLWYNLYSETRGVNRFKSCAHLLERFASYLSGLEEFVSFVNNSSELSNRALEKAIEDSDNSEVMKKALSWSLKVNESINALHDLVPFEGVKEAFAKVSEYCDIAAVSSANKKALCFEWEKYSLADYCTALMSQEEGTKTQCIKKLIDSGYDRDKIIMVGDALGDYEAAKDNGVYFYPIIVKRETECWNNILEDAVLPLTEKRLTQEKQEEWNRIFKAALSNS